MADRTTNITIESRVRGRSAVQIADGVTIGIGALVQLESGYLNHWSSAGANTFLGILIGGENVDANGAPVGDTSATPVPDGFVDDSGVILKGLSSVAGTPSQAKVGDLVYSADSDVDSITMTDPTGDNPPIGILYAFRSATDVDVQLFTPMEYKAGVAGATWTT